MHDLIHKMHHVSVREAELQITGLEILEIFQLVGHALQPFGVALYQQQRVSDFLFHGGRSNQLLQGAQDKRQR